MKFKEFALPMRRAGFAVLPSEGKKPLVGYGGWRTAPGTAVLEKWAEKFPDADLVYMAGLCRTGRSNPIIDGDAAEACEQIVERFGDTPGRVRTRRGKHFIYEDRDGRSLSKTSSLKAYGIDADVKHGRGGTGIVAAPPSVHEKDPSFRYAWDGCDETVIHHLPAFDRRALEALMKLAPAQSAGRSTSHQPLHGGSRGLGLNKFWCAKAHAIESFDDVLAYAREFNLELTSRGLPQLDDKEIAERGKRFWNDLQSGKVRLWRGKRATCRSDADEARHLVALAQNGADALALLMLLRAEHGARCKRGENFVLVVKAMVEQHTLGK